jgi:hypothetical protein
LQISSGISVRVLGDYGPFSRIGKSIGYQVTIGESCYLIDCGSPVFQKFGGHGLKAIKGLIITHCHDDHKRWFSDFALFNRYAPDVEHRLPLMTSERVNQGLDEGSSPALSMSLDVDCMRVIDIAYEEYVDFTSIAPKPKYRIERKLEKDGISTLVVADQQGCPLPPDRAKIFIGSSGVPRLLFRDPPSGEWVEPESFYPFSSHVFYEERRTLFRDSEGFTIEAINAPVWHGVPSIGVKFCTAEETLIFSADTNHDLELWTEMYSRKIPQNRRISDSEFEESGVIFGDINDYIERIWSEERFRDAVAAFTDAIVIHDIFLRRSVVHTDYRRLNHTTLDRSKTILTHSPDKMTSEWLLSAAEKEFRVTGETFCEVVNSRDLPVIGDYFHKEDGKYYVCFKNSSGRHSIYERDSVLSLSTDPFRGEGSFVTNIDVYEDINGQYFPLIENETSHYSWRPDGRVELLEYDDSGSCGRIVEDSRPRLTREFLSRN